MCIYNVGGWMWVRDENQKPGRSLLKKMGPAQDKYVDEIVC